MKEGYFRIKKEKITENFYLDKDVFVVLTPNNICVYDMNTIDYTKKKDEVIDCLMTNNPDLKYIGDKMNIDANYKNILTGESGRAISKITHKRYEDFIEFIFKIDYFGNHVSVKNIVDKSFKVKL